MGLDFSLYKKRKDINIRKFWDEVDKIEYKEFVDTYELAYGRKSWELVYELATEDDIKEGYGILKPESWTKLMNSLSSIGDNLNDIAKAYNNLYYSHNATYPELFVTEEDRKLITRYEHWYHDTFNDTPTLGYDFSVGYMISFWEAKDKVYEVFRDPNYEVLMYISY